MVDTERLVTENLGLVHACAGRFSGKGCEYDDLYQAGCVGLVKAAQRFDETRGFCFSTYAVPVILGEIKRIFRDGGEIKVSRSLKELSLKVRRAAEQLESELNAEPTVSQIAEYLGVDAESVSEAICSSRPAVSLTAGDDENSEMPVPTESVEDSLQNKLLIDGLLKKLSEPEQKLIRYRYFDYLTQSETAKLMSMTQVQVSRSEKKILLKLRDVLSN